MTMRVFRIEYDNGRGICAATGSPLCEIYYRLCGDENEHCSFAKYCPRGCKHKVERAWDNPNGSFAFPSLLALKTWFPQARGRNEMQRNGARLHVYEVPQVLAGTPFQCIFDKSKATLVERLDLATLTPALREI